MGHDFARNKGGIYSNLWSNNVQPDFDERTHKLSTTLFFLYTQSFNSSRSWLRKLIPWEGRGMEADVIPGWLCSLEKPIFFLLGKEIRRMGSHSTLLIDRERFIIIHSSSFTQGRRGTHSIDPFDPYPHAEYHLADAARDSIGIRFVLCSVSFHLSLARNPGCLCYSVFMCYRVEPCFFVLPCGLFLCVPWFEYELYARLRSGRDAEMDW